MNRAPTYPATNHLDLVLWECFRHFAYLDESNAAIHCAPTRFSPLTFRLAELLADKRRDETWENDKRNLISYVLDHQGAYAEDRGR